MSTQHNGWQFFCLISLILIAKCQSQQQCQMPTNNSSVVQYCIALESYVRCVVLQLKDNKYIDMAATVNQELGNAYRTNQVQCSMDVDMLIADTLSANSNSTDQRCMQRLMNTVLAGSTNPNLLCEELRHFMTCTILAFGLQDVDVFSREWDQLQRDFDKAMGQLDVWCTFDLFDFINDAVSSSHRMNYGSVTAGITSLIYAVMFNL